MFDEKDNTSKIDNEIKAELERIRKLSDNDLRKIYGGMGHGDTREKFSMNADEISRSIFGDRFFND